MLFQGKGDPLGGINVLKKDLTSKTHLLEGIQQILSSPPSFNLREYKKLKNEVIETTS
jgi:hypothetical protein